MDYVTDGPCYSVHDKVCTLGMLSYYDPVSWHNHHDPPSLPGAGFLLMVFQPTWCWAVLWLADNVWCSFKMVSWMAVESDDVMVAIFHLGASPELRLAYDSSHVWLWIQIRGGSQQSSKHASSRGWLWPAFVDPTPCCTCTYPSVTPIGWRIKWVVLWVAA